MIFWLALALARDPTSPHAWVPALESAEGEFSRLWPLWLDPAAGPAPVPVDTHLQALRDARAIARAREQMLLRLLADQDALELESASLASRRSALVASLDEDLVAVHARRVASTRALAAAFGDQADLVTDWSTAYEQCLRGEEDVCPRVQRLWAHLVARAGEPGLPRADAAARLEADIYEELRQTARRRALVADADADPVGLATELTAEVERVRAGGDNLDAEITNWIEAHSEAPADPRAPATRALADTYLALAVASPVQPLQIDPTRWCALWVHGGALFAHLGDSRAAGWLRVAAGARDGVCRGAAAPLLASPTFASAWAEASLDLAYGDPVVVRVALDDGRWRVDGVPVVGREVEELRLRPGTHRFEREGDENVVFVREEELRAGETVAVWFDGTRVDIQGLLPGANAWGWSLRGSGATVDALAGSAVVDLAFDPRRPHVSVAPALGVAFDHRQWVANVGGAALVQPAGRAHLGALLGVSVALGENPYYLSRFEAETRLYTVQGGARWTPLLGRTLSPWVQLGAFVEPGITAGPVAGVGGSLRLQRALLDLGVVVPYSVPDRLGHWNVAFELSPRLLLPLHRAAGRAPEP